MIREAIQDLNRLRQISVIAGRYGFADLLERAGLRKPSDGPLEVDTEAHTSPAARRFRLALAELGPTFVKLGQVLSTRADLLPPDFIDELSLLQDRVPPFPFEQVRAQVKTAFGQEIEALYDDFSPAPLAAASIAQVHRARLKSGEEVIVKVQRPDISEQLRADMAVLNYLARALEAVVEEGSVYSPTGVVAEFDRAVHEELNFLHEADNLRAFFKNHAGVPEVKIPRVYDALCASTVLTMEFIDAPKLSQANLDEAGRQALAKTIIKMAFTQLFEHGLFHGDPHPGNMLVLPGPVLALIDFGVVGRVSRQMQDTLVQLILGIGLQDPDSVARTLYRLGAPDARTNLHAFRLDIEALFNRYFTAALRDIDSRHLLADLLSLLSKYRIRVPREFAILTRAAIALEGLLRSLYPEMPIGEMFVPYGKQLLSERFDPSDLQGGLLKTLLRLQGAANDVPLQLQQILTDLESGRFVVNLKGEQLDTLNNSIRAFAVVAFSGMLASAFIIGAFIAFAQKPIEVWGVPVLGLLGVGGAVFLSTTAVVRQMWRGFRKISLKRLIGKS